MLEPVSTSHFEYKIVLFHFLNIRCPFYCPFSVHFLVFPPPKLEPPWGKIIFLESLLKGLLTLRIPRVLVPTSDTKVEPTPPPLPRYFKTTETFLPRKSFLLLYQTSEEPYYKYLFGVSSVVWGHCSETSKYKLKKLRNRAARSVSKLTLFHVGFFVFCSIC